MMRSRRLLRKRLSTKHDKAAVETELNNLKELVNKCDAENMTEDQVTELKAAQEKAMTAAQKLFEKMYEQAQGAQGAGPDMSNMGNMGGMGGQGSTGSDDGNADGDVVDGDYREV